MLTKERIMSVFDMLNIDETEGIDPTEIKAIEATLTRIKVAAAGVAKDNDTEDTLAILKQVEKVVRRIVSSGVHSVDELHQQLATNSSSAPAAQLGAGGAGSTDGTQATTAEEAYRVILNSGDVSDGLKAAMRRMFNPSDPSPLAVETDGTPVGITTANRERDAMKAERDSARQAKDEAEQKLKDEKDPNKSGSLQHKLDQAEAQAATPPDMVKKSDMKASLEDIRKDVDDLSVKFGAKVNGKKELLDKLDDGISKL